MAGVPFITAIGGLFVPAGSLHAMPTVVQLVLGQPLVLGTILLVRHWSTGKSEFAAQPGDPEMDALRDRIRRETGEEGGY